MFCFSNLVLKKTVLSYVIQHLNDKLIHIMRFIYTNFHNDMFKNFISTSSYIFFSFNAACYFLENSFAVELLISFEKCKCICKQKKKMKSSEFAYLNEIDIICIICNSVLLNCAKCTKRRIIVIYNYMKTKIERVFFF